MSATTYDTRDRLLDTAERLFAERGIDATSLRHITAEADANLASVNYHFGTKEELVRELFARRIGPINREGRTSSPPARPAAIPRSNACSAPFSARPCACDSTPRTAASTSRACWAGSTASRPS